MSLPYLGLGDGTFGLRILIDAGTAIRDIGVSDFDGDGHLDLALANSNSPDDSVRILFGLGTGDFGSPLDLPAQGKPEDLEIADFNGDGHDDVILCIDTFPAPLHLWLGDGQGGFSSGILVGDHSFSSFLSTGDFDGDGHPLGTTSTLR